MGQVDGRFTGAPDEVSARMRMIKSKGTKPELAFFAILADAEISYQAHVKVAGVVVDASIDNRVVVFVDSPFWHLRDSSELDRLSELWRSRLVANRRRDRRQVRHLRMKGYTVVRLWTDELLASKVRRRVRSARTKAARAAAHRS
jgi:DNA mismatch endonuclease Vsr